MSSSTVSQQDDSTLNYIKSICEAMIYSHAYYDCFSITSLAFSSLTCLPVGKKRHELAMHTLGPALSKGKKPDKLFTV